MKVTVHHGDGEKMESRLEAGGSLKAIAITTDKGNTLHYISHNKKTYPIHGGLYSGSPNLDMVSNKSLKELKKVAESKGWKVETVSKKQYETNNKKYWDEQAKKPDYSLGHTENGMLPKNKRVQIIRPSRNKW